jgi:hypothetical protein
MATACPPLSGPTSRAWSIRLLGRIILALAALSPGQVLAQTVAPARTVYISVRSDGLAGDGSAANPYNGSDAAKLDALMESLPAGPLRVRFGLGVFVTMVGIPVKNGWTVQGEGPARTTIRLASGVLREKGQSALLIGGYDFGGATTLLEYACVRDLSIDGNRQGQPGYRLNVPGGIDAVVLWARQSRIENVRVYHTYTTPGEGFPVHIYSTGGTLTKPNRADIERVHVYFHEGNATAISVFDQTGGRITGGIRHCYIKGYGRPPSSTGFGAGGWVDFEVSDNRVAGMACGVTIDTHNYTRVRFLRNTFTGLYKFGFLVNGGGQYDSLTFRGNRTELIPSDGAHYKFDVTRPTNLRLEENTLISRGTPITVAMHGGGNAEGVIRANRLSPGVSFRPPKSSRLRVFDNETLKAAAK